MRSLRAISFCWAVLTCFWMSVHAAAAASCESRVAIGDQSVGISAVQDASCKNGGLGCFSDGTCRFCQKVAFPQSNHLLKCSSIAPTSQTSAPTTAPPTTAPPATSPPTADCSEIVKKSTLNGISFVTDNACTVARPTAIGCTARTSCRLCRTSKNEANQFLVNCAVFKKPDTALAQTIVLSEGAAGIVEGPGSPKYTDILLACLSVMALVVAILGLAHFKVCHRDNPDMSCSAAEIGFVDHASYCINSEKARV
ncbi:hypothetical protein PHYSODRAFT_262347 [Phytophthora sojae]|uniref:Uncharacterized protein n=1 Tax=Phytophthora sojae (strain P6497) TaxID=1094619 RepID=G4ZKN3_PHYSP|nr:hypothetical protein PHYSODRAFT_262347 [Phytophthora sojae]EGZ16214.1 hypothetical protein PHYSODRAFT_262347 [Phytophthora sojae]|eukprot:XP_009529963.1 hypothetical protein PHYSODRAFT_262347 [Phytophthora sojae]